MPVEKVDWDKHDVVECDERGRATLGTEYAGERVFVYVSELPEERDLGEYTSEEEADVLMQMRSWAKENDIDTMFHLLDPIHGVVTDKQGNEHQTPYSLEWENNEPL